MSNTSNVIVYSSENCPYCMQLKKYLKDQQVDFEERNISLNEEYANELESMGISSVPLTVIGEHKILGMNITRLKKALAE
ncbi:MULTISPECIES: glutaredoxin family protein [unclassified Paenibacillus]|uniref:glutaredoxin family protein n=1 Tax=unclassified Paenibacillus TaxID=185978 RepID=UPI001AE3259A|nr:MULTISPECIES: glutaredoxin family protein [unclassified Paenibacillus]MBP1156933.1 glutaredoxin [Paenibacillus sp. PvP091]MBP1172328.1 glutaredoxin [Paenibacillus sp. PvR098]MBP2438709.1 glutaredoxin [Paenibacillus sp. PvP052]